MKKILIILAIILIAGSTVQSQLTTLHTGKTIITDSTNYTVFNKGVIISDSLKVKKDIYMVFGKFYMDTLRQMRIYAFTNQMMIENNKSGGGIIFWLGDKNGSMSVNSVIGGTGNTIFTLDTAGLFLRNKSKYSFLGNTNTGMKELGADSLTLFANSQNQIVIGKYLITNNLRTSFPQITIPQTGTQPMVAPNNCNMYVKDDKLIWFYNEGGSDRWYYIDLTSTSTQQVIYSATEP